MHILQIIPAINIPRPADQVLTYFCPQKVEIGGLVLVKVRNALQAGLVIDAEAVKQRKSTLRKANFELRKVEKIISTKPIIPPYLIQFIQQEADYWWTSCGLILKNLLPAYLINYIKKNQQLPPVTLLANKITKNEQTLELIPYLILPLKEAKKTEGRQNISSFKNKEGRKLTFYSGHLTPKQKFESWNKIRAGQIKRVRATRSGIYLPFVNLKKIIVHQAESAAYKSWDQKPYYDARRSAIHLAKITGAKLEFKTPTPPIWLKKPVSAIPYAVSSIKQKPQAKVELIDLKKYTPKSKTPPLFTEPALKALKNSKKALIFHNRRGAARLTYCADCGHRFSCPNCQIPLILHLPDRGSPIADRALLCHHCGHCEKAPTICSKCKSANLKTFGAGTSELELQITNCKLQKTTFRLDQDITPKLSDQLGVIKQFSRSDKAVLVATAQVIKFLNQSLQYPNIPIPQHPGTIDLSIVPLADLELNFPDYLVRETAFQSFYQLMLATRRQLIIQTLKPKDSLFAYLAKKTYNGFIKQEMTLRRQFYFPPFSHLIKLCYSHANQAKARQQAFALYEKLKTQLQNARPDTEFSRAQNLNSIQILGPAPAFIPYQKGQNRWQIFLKLPPGEVGLKDRLLYIVPGDWQVDVEPIDTL